MYLRRYIICILHPVFVINVVFAIWCTGYIFTAILTTEVKLLFVIWHCECFNTVHVYVCSVYCKCFNSVHVYVCSVSSAICQSQSAEDEHGGRDTEIEKWRLLRGQRKRSGLRQVCRTSKHCTIHFKKLILFDNKISWFIDVNKFNFRTKTYKLHLDGTTTWLS